MQTLARRAFAGPCDLDSALGLVAACRTAGRAVPWPSLGELRADLLAQPSAWAWIWEDDQGRARAVAMLWEGSVLLSAVDPQLDGEDLERELLRCARDAAVHDARMHGVRGSLFVPVCCDDHAEIALLEREGFLADEWRTLLMQRSLRAPLPEPAVPEGFSVHQVGAEGETANLAALHNEIFVGLPKTRADQRQIRHAESYRRALDLVATAPDGELAAFCFGTVSAEGVGSGLEPVGWIERVGVRQHNRRLGLGRAIVLYALHAMRVEGLGAAKLITGATNTAARKLFETCGFRTACEICWYVWGEP